MFITSSALPVSSAGTGAEIESFFVVVINRFVNISDFVWVINSIYLIIRFSVVPTTRSGCSSPTFRTIRIVLLNSKPKPGFSLHPTHHQLALHLPQALPLAHQDIATPPSHRHHRVSGITERFLQNVPT